jgi:hypothetical protein
MTVLNVFVRLNFHATKPYPMNLLGSEGATFSFAVAKVDDGVEFCRWTASDQSAV